MIWTPDPIAFSFGSFSVHWYGIFWAVSMLVTHWGMMRESQRVQWPVADLDKFVFWACLGAILGGRVGYVLFYQTHWLWTDFWQIFIIWQGGLSFHGGLIGGALAAFIVTKRADKTFKQFLRALDLATLWVPIGLALVRIGNFVNGELWGRHTDASAWYGIIFANDPSGMPRHPSQLYEMALEGIALLLIMRLLATHTRMLNYSGLATGIALAWYGLARITVELVREPDAHLGYLAYDFVTAGMLLSLPLVAGGFVLGVLAVKGKRTD